MTFKGLSKVKSMASSYVLLRVKQFLSETFLSTGFSFRDIGLDHLKWDTLYICNRKRYETYVYERISRRLSMLNGW